MKFCHYFNNDKECPFETLGCMFKHQDAPQCKYSDKCLKTLCQFKHKEEKDQNKCKKCDFIFKNQKVSEVHVCDDHDKNLTEGEKEFELYVKTNFRKVYDSFLENQKHLPCSFCEYISQSHILKYSADELSDHMEENHDEIVTAFNLDSSRFENDSCKEFLKFLLIG